MDAADAQARKAARKAEKKRKRQAAAALQQNGIETAPLAVENGMAEGGAALLLQKKRKYHVENGQGELFCSLAPGSTPLYV